MSIIPASPSPTHELPGARFTARAAPSLGSAETSVWQVEIEPGTPATPHALTREEVFVVLDGVASVQLGGTSGTAGPGDAIVVPPDTEFGLGNPGAAPLRLLCCLPVGGQARLADGTTFTPPWAV